MAPTPADDAVLAPDTVTRFSQGDIRDPAPSPRRASRPRSKPVATRQVPRAALELALRLADGDHSRLVFGPDGSVTVANRPRT